MQLKNKMQLENRKQDESCQKIQEPREREREKSRWQGKTSEEKQQKKRFEEEIVDAPFESNINTVVEKHLVRNYTC